MSGGKIRYGVFGARRGSFFMKDFILALGFELVAICDKDEALLRRCGAAFPKAATFTDFHAFIREEMDVVVLCNYFDEHAPYAIDALKAGKHVISETIPAVNMAELIALVETVKNSGLIYLLAEDYPFTAFSQRMASIYRSGEIGEVLFADGQYNNAISAEELALCQDPSHWKNNLAPTYYLTHALAPLVQITGQLPDQVSAVPLTAGREAILGGTLCKGDPGFAMTVVTRDKALFRIMGINVPGHAIWYSLHGTRGAMETERTTGAHYPENYWGSGRVRVWHDAHNKGGYPLQRFEVPEFTSLADLAAKTTRRRRAFRDGGFQAGVSWRERAGDAYRSRGFPGRRRHPGLAELPGGRAAHRHP